MISRIPASPPVIKPLSTKEKRPLWSVMIPVYNCSQYIPETLQTVLNENVPEEDMQIEVVDDASTDADIEAMVGRIGKGRIKYFRQPQNAGSLRNFETCLNRARGRLIHLLHGDDRIKPGYYQKIGKLFQQYPEAGAAFCRVNYIEANGKHNSPGTLLMNHDGLLENWLLRIAESNYIQYACITVRREVYERLGAFFGTTYGEDWEMWVRIAQYYPVAYTPECLADYRIHETSISGDKFLKGESVKDIKKVMNVFKTYLPKSKQKTVLRKTKRNFAWYSWFIANSTWHRTQNKQATRTLIKQAFLISKPYFKISWELGKLYIRTIINKPIERKITPLGQPEVNFSDKNRIPLK